jgi:hypothetical protein
MQIEKKDIRAVSKDLLREFFVTQGDKAFRGIRYTNGCGAKAPIVLRI